MLHPFREASKTTLRPTGEAEERLPGWELFSLLGAVSEWLEGAAAHMQGTLSKEAATVYVFYRDVAYTAGDLLGLFGRAMAQIDQSWKICAFGTAENQETIRLKAELHPEGTTLTQQSLSGECAEVLRTLCFQIDCGQTETAQALMRLLGAADWESGIAALSGWQDAAFLKEQGLFVETDRAGFFCYGSVNERVATRELLCALNFEQKMTLWNAFLGDGFDSAEFWWILEQIEEDGPDNRLEWELALWEVLDRLGFQIVNDEKAFAVYDARGERIYFGAESTRAAPRVFLKILFPLNY